MIEDSFLNQQIYVIVALKFLHHSGLLFICGLAFLMAAGFSCTNVEEKPVEIKNWVTELQKLDRSPLWHKKELGDSLYIYVGWGSKPTGGYQVEITSVEEVNDSELVVHASFTAPASDAFVTQALTNPYDFIAIRNTGLPVRIEKTGNDAPRFILTIRGIEHMEKVVAGSESIKLFGPEPGASVSPVFEVRGLASVFEATVNYRILNAEGDVILEDFTTAYESMNWGFFSFEPDSTSLAAIESEEEIQLEIFNINAKDGEEINKFRIPLNITI